LLATILCLALFTYLSVIGYAVLSLLSDEEPLYLLLLSPVTGAAVVMLLTFTGNQIGVPIRYFAHALVVLVLAAALVVLWRRGRRVPIGDVRPYVLLICLGLLITGWPMLRFGFDWVSFCNDDMANYCMGAERVLNYGYSQAPDSRALAGQDYTQFLWFLHVLHRPGSEMVLATVTAITRLLPLRIFMPTILAFMLCQISAAGAMAYAAIRSRLAVWLTMLLVGMSALVALGSLYQLIAQVIGLAMLAGLVAVLLRPIDELARGSRLKIGILIALLTAGLVVAYAELLPFIVIGYGLYVLLTLRSWKNLVPRGLAVLGIAAGFLVVLLNRFLPFAVLYVLKQARGVQSEDPLRTLFPYYMIPSGPVYFWGLFSVGDQLPDDLWLSVLVAGALVLSALVGVLLVRSLLRRQAPAVISVVMAVVFFGLFRNHSGFGMYKLAMYCQPFILTAVVVGWISMWRRRWVQVIPLLVLGLAGLRAHLGYVNTSLGEGRGAFSEIPGASPTHIVREYDDILAANPGRPLELDPYNVVLAKFQMSESRGRTAMFPSANFLPNIVMMSIPGSLTGRAVEQRAAEIIHDYQALYPERRFNMHPDQPGQPPFDRFPLVRLGQHAGSADHPVLFVGQTGRQAPINRWHDPENEGGNFRSGNIDAFREHLILITSHLSAVPGQRVAVYQLESDLLFLGRTMAAVGRHMFFQIVEPSPKVRLELSLTDSLAGNGEDLLPPAEVIGAQRASMPIVGRGSARVFSEPVTPQMIDGRAFVALDMGTDGTFFKDIRGGLMQLWGRNVRLDPRQMTAFLRDVSLVSEEQYQAMNAPSELQRFPADLMNKDLEYSGIYEDGWAADRMYVMLNQPNGPAKLVCQMLVPLINDKGFSTEINLRVDGKVVTRKTVGLGDVELSADLPPDAGHRRIELSFSKSQRLPDPDNRPFGARLKSISIQPGTATAQR
jgi:uncharacterized membrane protein YphA (DoxX/SURF4 family)